ncbi:hypothetical protein DES34_101366 [Brevibacillus brevis]|nr:hypothetical protein C7J99_17570 [Brevibacillus brevis]RED35707.1 hypothetical protein DES34_101366 [Brevibacillus brevis]TQK53416.1 hypothetical protein FB479_11053 [Brevibacillus sp. AG162]GEC89251.1 hypothetical protein BBR01nite_15820 [Brevibacillus brevis]VEF89182.1 Uncharacterised protein [Brevibacillus brevis]
MTIQFLHFESLADEQPIMQNYIQFIKMLFHELNFILIERENVYTKCKCIGAFESLIDDIDVDYFTNYVSLGYSCCLH